MISFLYDGLPRQMAPRLPEAGVVFGSDTWAWWGSGVHFDSDEDPRSDDDLLLVQRLSDQIWEGQFWEVSEAELGEDVWIEWKVRFKFEELFWRAIFPNDVASLLLYLARRRDCCCYEKDRPSIRSGNEHPFLTRLITPRPTKVLNPFSGRVMWLSERPDLWRWCEAAFGVTVRFREP